MKIFEFNKYFPDEATRRRNFKDMFAEHKSQVIIGKVLPRVHIAISNSNEQRTYRKTA